MKRFIIAFMLSTLVAACGSNELETSVPNANAQQTLSIQTQSRSSQVPTSAAIAGYRKNFEVSRVNGVVTLVNKITKEVTTYPGVTLIKFVDKHLAFNTDGAEARTFRLYQAAFNRKPDAAGLGFWIKAAQAGTYLESIAAAFISSSEFETIYGRQVTPEQFTSRLYFNILGREGEKAGVDFWVSAIKSGTIREGILYGFSESEENRKRVQPDLIGGIEYVPYNEGGPIIPQPTSYLNSKNIGIGPQKIPYLKGVKVESLHNAYGFADFFQNGKLTMVGFSEKRPAEGYASTQPGNIYFFDTAPDGTWVDKTANLIDDTTGCVAPRKVVIADFNSDGKPDIFVACHGYDAGSFPGESPRIFLSQADGKYKNVLIAMNCFCHGATAGDVDRDGNIDILIADMRGQGGKTPLYFLMGDGAGGFKIDYSRVARPEFDYRPAFWTVELIANGNTGLLDIYAGGTESFSNAQGVVVAGTKTQIIRGRTDGFFVGTQSVPLPTVAKYETVLDFLIDNENLYVVRTMTEPSYGGALIQKVNLATGMTSILYEHSSAYEAFGEWPPYWINWISIFNNQVIALNSYYNVAINK